MAWVILMPRQLWFFYLYRGKSAHVPVRGDCKAVRKYRGHHLSCSRGRSVPRSTGEFPLAFFCRSERALPLCMPSILFNIPDSAIPVVLVIVRIMSRYRFQWRVSGHFQAPDVMLTDLEAEFHLELSRFKFSERYFLPSCRLDPLLSGLSLCHSICI